MRIGRIALATLAGLLLAAGTVEAQADDAEYGDAVAVEGGEYRDIIVLELQSMMDAEDVSLINVHIPFAGNIPGTDESIPFNEIPAHMDQLPADKDAPVVLYCRSGPMSERAAAELVELGYTDVYNLEGGLLAWSSAGLPLEGQ